MSDDLESWEELETKGKDITVEKTVTTNGNHTFYFQDEAENIQDVTVTATKIDDKKPIANMSVTKTNNIITINASNSRDNETSISKYYYSKDGTNYVESTENKFQFTNEYEYGIATAMLTNFEANQIKKVYVKVEDEVGNVSDVKEYNITSTDLAYDETTDNNLRYIGANPNNYISFNDELWRIIGVMNNIDDGTGVKESRLKIIRNEVIGSFNWDATTSAINSGLGVNEWSQSKLMKLLNPGYESETIGGSLYWNKSSGKCYNGRYGATGTCNFLTSGLSNTSKNYIDSVLWNIGSNGNEAVYNEINTSKFYELERSNNNGKICSSGLECTDTVARTTIWKGKVGLMQPSDYGYATSGGATTSRAVCLNTVLYNWGSEEVSACKNNNWLYNSSVIQWTITSHALQSYSNLIFTLRSTGDMYGYEAGFTNYVRPSVYLLKNIKIANGIGTDSSPFLLSLD